MVVYREKEKCNTAVVLVGILFLYKLNLYFFMGDGQVYSIELNSKVTYH